MTQNFRKQYSVHWRCSVTLWFFFPLPGRTAGWWPLNLSRQRRKCKMVQVRWNSENIGREKPL